MLRKVENLAGVPFFRDRGCDLVCKVVVSKSGYSESDVAMALAILKDSTLAEIEPIRWGGWKAEQPMYPASVVKLFYLAHYHWLLAEGTVMPTPEHGRALSDMIKDSSNDATGLIVDILSGTTGGPELHDEELRMWMNRRQSTNRFLKDLGFANLNVCQKTWNEGPYGRELQGYGRDRELRNSLAASHAVKMMALIGRKALSGSESMLELLSRPIPAEGGPPDFQSQAFIGGALPAGFRLWSKAGYVTDERHDVAFIEFPTELKITMAIFTHGKAVSPAIVPRVAKTFFEQFENFSEMINEDLSNFRES